MRELFTLEHGTYDDHVVCAVFDTRAEAEAAARDYNDTYIERYGLLSKYDRAFVGRLAFFPAGTWHPGASYGLADDVVVDGEIVPERPALGAGECFC